MTTATVSTVTTNNVQKIESAFYAALGTGTVAAKHMADLIKSVSVSRDTTIISKAMTRAKEKGDDKAASVLGLAMREVFPKVKVTNKAGKYSFTIKGIQADEKAVARLESAVAKNLSIRGDTFRKAIMAEKPVATPVIDYKKKAENIQKSGADLDKMIAALQALRGVNANATETTA